MRDSQWSSQRASASGSKISRSRTSSQARSESASADILSRVSSCSSRMVSVRWVCTIGAHVDVRRGHGDRELDRELVARRGLVAHRLGEPPGHQCAALGGDLVDDAALVVDLEVGHEAVALGARQGRVDLPDVEQPGAAGALLERRLELVAVRRPLVEQGQQPPSDRHTEYLYRVCKAVSSTRREPLTDRRADAGARIGGVTLLPEPFEELSADQLRARTSIKWRMHGPDVLPLWVAEMDAMPAPSIVEAVTAAMRAGDTGYPSPDTTYAESFAALARRRWGWELDVAATSMAADVLTGMRALLVALTEPGGGVVIPSPVYPPFFMITEESGRRVVPAALTAEHRLDPDAIDRALAEIRRARGACCAARTTPPAPSTPPTSSPRSRPSPRRAGPPSSSTRSTRRSCPRAGASRRTSR